MNVGDWHETDMPTVLRNVRSRQSGRHLLVASISPFDPSALVHGVGQDALAARIDEADRPAIRRAVND